MGDNTKATSATKNVLVKSERLSSQVCRLILSDIQKSTLKPGDRLASEAELSQKYGVSRSILREAIASLKEDDVLESRQGIGIIIKNPNERQAFRFSDIFDSISVDNIDFFYEMRAILESAAAGLAAIRHTQEDMDAIKDALSDMEKAVQNNSLGNASHTRYNAAIAKASHNPVLIGFLEFLRNRLQNLAKELRLQTMISPHRAETVIKEHQYIVQCIEEGVAEKAQSAVMTHLINAAHRSGRKIMI